MSTRLDRGVQPPLHGDPLDQLAQATKRELLKLRGEPLPQRALVAVIIYEVEEDTLHPTVGGDGKPDSAHQVLEEAARQAKEAAS